LFYGTGVSVNDVIATKNILDSSHLNYATVTSSELNAMNQAHLIKYRLLIIPGGDFIKMGNSLSVVASTNIHYAVQHGLNYLGICASAFLAGKSRYYNGFNLTSGVTFGFYAAENNGIRKAAVLISNADNTMLDQYWEDGPQLSGWGMAIAKYPDGTPAITEGKFGKGYVILSGVHAEAPANWRSGMIFNTSAIADNAYAAMLIRSALNGVAVTHY
jgi:glutamine amidotransferase-like uncharacterized protein